MNKKIVIVSVLCLVALTGCGNENKSADKNITEECQVEGGCENAISGSLNTKKFKEKLESGEYDLIDIRTHDEYMKERIADVPNIDIYESDFDERIDYLDKDKKYLIYCEHGNRTKDGLKRMKLKGFPEVYDLDDGIEDWIDDGFETIGTK